MRILADGALAFAALFGALMTLVSGVGMYAALFLPDMGTPEDRLVGGVLSFLLLRWAAEGFLSGPYRLPRWYVFAAVLVNMCAGVAMLESAPPAWHWVSLLFLGWSFTLFFLDARRRR